MGPVKAKHLMDAQGVMDQMEDKMNKELRLSEELVL